MLHICCYEVQTHTYKYVNVHQACAGVTRISPLLQTQRNSNVKLGQKRNAPLDPMGLWNLRVHPNPHNKICTVPRSGQRPLAGTDLVRGTIVVIEHLELGPQLGLEVQQRRRHRQDLGLTFVQHPTLVVPPASLQKQPRGVHPVLRPLRGQCFQELLWCFKVKSHGVNGHLVLSGIVLQGSSGESLGEINSADPEDHRNALFEPCLEEVQPLNQIIHIGPEWLPGRIRFGEPHLRSLAVKYVVETSLQLSRHQQQSLNRLLNILQGIQDGHDQFVETLQLLPQHRVHTLIVQNRPFIRHGRNIEGLWHTTQHIGGHCSHDLLRTCVGATAGGSNRQQQRIHHRIGLVAVLGESGVVVEAENPRRRIRGEFSDKLQILLILHGVRTHILLPKECVPLLQGVCGVVVVQHCHDQPPVLVVCHAASVIALPSQVRQCLEWYFIGVLIQKHGQLHYGYSHVRLSEFIGDIPP
mmetsp:Transcript_40151/g.90202  ORF Transcript_40151/g.90202 Transcript_40151/m.90202 type:complete len:468 (-) Transcript_40151:800-2203(-)